MNEALASLKNRDTEVPPTLQLLDHGPESTDDFLQAVGDLA